MYIFKYIIIIIYSSRYSSSFLRYLIAFLVSIARYVGKRKKGHEN